MKRLTITAVVVGWLILVGYTAARPSLSPASVRAEATVTPLIPGPKPTARVPAELTYYRKRCWPACHYDASWISEEPDQLTQEFDQAPGDDWTWVNEDPEHWSLPEGEGVLRVMSQRDSLREKGGELEGVANVLAHEVPSEHFDIVTEVTFEGRGTFQSAGVFAELDDGSVLWLGRGTCEEDDDPACAGEGVYFDATGLDCDFEGAALAEDTVCLMLRKAGNSYIGYYHVREPGETEIPTELGWTEVGRCYHREGSPERVGLAVASGDPGAPEEPADFELARITERK